MTQETTRQAPVLITGSSGLIGSAICEDLAADYPLVELDVTRPDGGPRGEAFLECDLTDDASVERVVAQVRERFGGRIASVIHLAAYYDFSGEPSPLYDELTVEGTRRLLRALRDFEVEQIVFSSSLLVMQPAESGEVLTETSPVQAEWEYPQSKLAAEEVIAKERGDASAVILRLAGVYDEDGHSPPITQQIKRIHEKKLESFLFPGNPEHGQSFVHREDAVAAFRACVERRKRLDPLEVLLIGEPDVMSYGALQDRIGDLLYGHEWPTIRIPAPVAKAGAWLKEKAPVGEDPFIKPWMIDLADAHYPVSIERARERLGWQPRHSLAQTLEPMIDRLRSDPEAWYRENGLDDEDDG